ncbi:MAG: hypothetical protein CM1200mP25_1520 [Acidobacteriota bacterium]|nr:MAG: hypothetical protein CM1200mP25_1520 [Acidobacteriota bacterium]
MRKVPGVSHALAEQVTRFVQELRRAELYKATGVQKHLIGSPLLLRLTNKNLMRSPSNALLASFSKTRKTCKISAEIVFRTS